ncbi:MAG: hypothetical protein HY252_20145 [Sphingobacteriales bacterium]|nr:hypothetical protein [Sphingobacteriales bacterium]
MTIKLSKNATVNDIKVSCDTKELNSIADKIKNYIISRSDIFTPAKQNGYNVPFLERIKIEFAKKNFIISENNSY